MIQKHGPLKTSNTNKTRVSKNLKPYTIQKHGPLKTSNPSDTKTRASKNLKFSRLLFHDKKHANQENSLQTSTIMVYLLIFCFFFGIFRLPGLRLLETRVFVWLGFEVFSAIKFSVFWNSSSEVFRGNRQGYVHNMFMVFISPNCGIPRSSNPNFSMFSTTHKV